MKCSEYPSFVIVGGKIVKADDLDLYTYWLRNWSEFMSYTDFKNKCIENGTEVTESRKS